MSKDFDAKDVKLGDYEKEYTEDGLWEKIKKFAKKAGIKVIYYALLLFYALQSNKVSATEKAAIIGALGYFIMPLDIIPDVLPGGFFDDGGVLLLVIKMLGNIDDDVKDKAKAKLTEWFGNYDKSKLE